QMEPQGLFDLCLELIDQLFFGSDPFRRVSERPIAPHRGLSAVLDREEMARRELVNALEHRQRRLDETKRKVLLERREIDRRTSIVARQKRFDLGGAREASIILPVVERLLAQMIARHQQAPAARIPECECEHAAKVLEEPIAVALIERDDDFAIAVREEDMSASLEIAPELSIVVDLAIGDEADRTVVAAQRLCAAPQV